MSPARLSTTLQENFVKSELETGHRMLALGKDQRKLRQQEAARQSLDLARVALSGAERHLEAVNLPQIERDELSHDVDQLRREIETFEGAH